MKVQFTRPSGLEMIKFKEPKYTLKQVVKPGPEVSRGPWGQLDIKIAHSIVKYVLDPGVHYIFH